jgi:hypothetical protein
MSSRASTRQDGKKSTSSGSNNRASKRLSQERGSLLSGGGSSGSGDVGGDSEIRKIQRVLDRIPSDYKRAEDFNSLEHVIEILKSDDIDDRRARLENDVYEMDTSMETIVSCALVDFFGAGARGEFFFLFFLRQKKKNKTEVLLRCVFSRLQDHIVPSNSAFK